jgi:hypothetical protein
MFSVGMVFTSVDNELIRRGFNVSKMEWPFADWLAIFDFLHCRDGFGNITCDRFGRPWIYGSGFRAFSIFETESRFILFGLILALVTIILLVYFILPFSNRLITIAVAISPSFLFSFDRMNSSFIFLGVCAFLFLPYFDSSRKRQFYSIFLSTSLNIFKPLFILAGLRKTHRGYLNLMIFSVSISIAYFSMGGLKNLEVARNATWYDQHSQFGAQILGRMFLSGHGERIQTLLGILILLVFTLLTLKKNSSIFYAQSPLAPRLQNLCSSTASVYLIGYVSGSQVIYLSLTGIFLPIFLYRFIKGSSLYNELLLTFAFLGSLGLGFSFFKIFASAILAMIALQWLIFIFFKKTVFNFLTGYGFAQIRFRR